MSVSGPGQWNSPSRFIGADYRNDATAMMIGVSVVISLLQGGMSYSVLLGALRNRFNFGDQLLSALHWLARAALLILAGTLWTLKRKRAVFRVIII